MGPENAADELPPPALREQLWRCAGSVLIAIAAGLFWRRAYDAVQPLVVDYNETFPAGVLTPYIANWHVQRDGIEMYVLYALMFAVLLTTLAAYQLLHRLPSPTFLLGSTLLASAAVAVSAPVIFPAPEQASLSRAAVQDRISKEGVVRPIGEGKYVLVGPPP